MYKELFRLQGELDSVKEINTAIADQTGDPEPFFDEDSEEWRAWVEYKDGDTIVLYDGV